MGTKAVFFLLVSGGCVQFSSACDAVVYSHEVGVEKPDPRIFEHAMKRLGECAEESVFLDDVATNVDAARTLGMKAVPYETNVQAMAAIEAYLGAAW